MQGQPDGVADNTPCAIELLRDPDAAERDLFAYVIGDELREFEPVDWDAVGNEVYGGRAEALTEAYPQILDGVTLASLPEAVAAIPVSARKLDAEDSDDPNALVAHVLGDGALLALRGAGWTLTAEPAEPIGARLGEAVLAPHSVVGQLRTGQLDAETWRERVQSLGVSDLQLDAAAAPAA